MKETIYPSGKIKDFSTFFAVKVWLSSLCVHCILLLELDVFF